MKQRRLKRKPEAVDKDKEMQSNEGARTVETYRRNPSGRTSPAPSGRTSPALSGRTSPARVGDVVTRAERCEEERALMPLRARADRVMVVVAWGLWLASLGFAFLHGEWMAAMAVSLPLAVLATLTMLMTPGTLTCRLILAVFFMLDSGVLIHQAHGLVETHFSIFALLAFLLYYRDWRPVVAAGVAIFAEHLVACEMQMAGWPVFVFPMTHGRQMIWVHTAYVVVEVVVLVYLSQMVRREAVETLALTRFAEAALLTGVIDLREEAPGGLRSAVLDSLLCTLNRAVHRTDRVAGQLQGVSSEMRVAAAHILTAGRAQQVSSSGVIHAVERMAETARTVTECCAEVDVIARGAAEVMAVGHETMCATGHSMQHVVEIVGKVAEQMQGLRHESSRIGEMIDVMTDVAQQTDLLALNATIEAAGAGDFGRGFNVVAQEIRLLSTRAHESLRQARERMDRVYLQTDVVCTLAEQCRQGAERGGRAVNAAGQRLEQVVHQIPLILGSVAQASEQAGRCGRLSEDAVHEACTINAMIAGNGDELSNLAALSEALRGMSSDLLESVSTFRMREETRQLAAMAAIAA